MGRKNPAPRDPKCKTCGHALSAHGFGKGTACLVGWSNKLGGCACKAFTS